MPSALHHLSLKQKLILFSLVPLLMMSFFILTRMHGLINESHSAKHNHLAVQATVHITELLYQLQNEYGLSTNQLPADNALVAQQQATSNAFNTLLNSEPLAHLNEALDPKSIEASQMNTLLDAITLTGHRLANARQPLRAKHKARFLTAIVNCTLSCCSSFNNCSYRPTKSANPALIPIY